MSSFTIEDCCAFIRNMSLTMSTGISLAMFAFSRLVVQSVRSVKNICVADKFYLTLNSGQFSIGKRYYQILRMRKSALLIVAAGSEEMEAVISADVMRRGDIDVTIAGLSGDKVVQCSREVVLQPDISLQDVSDKAFDCIVLPGGLGGAKALADSELVGKLLQKQESAGKLIAAICAAPTVLLAHSIGIGKSITSYPAPAIRDQLIEKYKYVDDQITVQDGHLITSQGPATAFDFAIKIVENLQGAEKAMEVSKGLLLEKIKS